MNKADVIIIGSGVIGNAAAYHLAKAGKSVIVLEKDDNIGDGGSTRNGGGVRQSGRHPAELPLAMFGVKNLWPNLSEDLGVDVEYYQEGNLRLGKTDKHLDILNGLTDRAKTLGLEVEMIDGEQARDINPYLSDEVIGASWCPTDGHANPLLVTMAYYKKARELGAQFVTGEEVLEIRKVRGSARKVVTQTNTYEADKIILAAGLGSRKIANTIGLDVPMNPVLLEVLVTEAQPEMFYQMLGTAEADFYGHQSTHGSFVFGGTSGLDAYQEYDPEQATQSATAPCICRGILKYFPEMKEFKIIRTWAGTIDDCVDHIPVISHVEEVPGLILACGFSGHGFGISPTVGLLLSEMAMDQETTLDTSAFRYDRFKTKI
ncbi:FAD-binding oxidoreductase [Eubacteriaceae bacterium ES3]|nr:FAD-binding oxidoreductase [Eubacteriaceae bacterium ES3]